jgi:hypothetical protein
MLLHGKSLVIERINGHLPVDEALVEPDLERCWVTQVIQTPLARRPLFSGDAIGQIEFPDYLRCIDCLEFL